MNDFFDLHLGWIRQSNLIEGIDDPIADLDCVEAWKRFTENNALDRENVLRCHSDIMLRKASRLAGAIRKCNVRVGSRIWPDFKVVPNLLKKWLETYANVKDFETIREAHIIFERIHPFEDGNGRTGRMIMNWQLLKAGLEIYIFDHVNRKDYYEWFSERVKSWKGSIGESYYASLFIDGLADGRGWLK